MKEGKLEIGFGDIFKVNSDPDRTDVVIDVGKGDKFFAARVTEDEGVVYISSLPGTAVAGDVKSVEGRMSVDEVLGAAEEGARRKGSALSDKERKLYEECSVKGRRKL